MADLDLDTIRARHARAPHRGPHLDGGEAAHADRGVLLAKLDLARDDAKALRGWIGDALAELDAGKEWDARSWLRLALGETDA